MSRVEVQGLTKTFGTVDALRGVELDVPAGDLLAVLGPSGCGKTTLLRIIAGFERQDAGTVMLDGVPVADRPERRRIGIVPQEGALFPHLDVAGNVGFGVAREERRARVEEMLELIGMSGLGARRPDQLSGGQQQRVAVARALAPKPAVVLLDEPFTALDAGLRASLRGQVAALLRSTRTTAMLVTHDQVEALSMADTVAVMRDGAIVQTGSPAEVYARPADLETAKFLGDAVVLAGDAKAGVIQTSLGPIGVGAQHGPVTVVLRPEQLVRDDNASLRATVVGFTFHGHDAFVSLEVGGQVVVARWPASTATRVGDLVGVRVVGDAVAYPRSGPKLTRGGASDWDENAR